MAIATVVSFDLDRIYRVATGTSRSVTGPALGR